MVQDGLLSLMNWKTSKYMLNLDLKISLRTNFTVAFENLLENLIDS